MHAFWAGFEKEAGLIQRLADKLKGAATGAEHLYHGTSVSKAKTILQHGIKPGQAGGISGHSLADAAGKTMGEASKGLVFLTRDKKSAKYYAKQQQGLELIEKGHQHLKSLAETRKGKLGGRALEVASGALDELPALKAVAAQKYTKLPFVPKGQTLKVKLPKEDVARRARVNPEIEIAHKKYDQFSKESPVMTRLRMGSRKAVAETPFKHDVVLEGEVAPHHIKKAFFEGFEKAAAMKEVATVALIHGDTMLMGLRRDNKRWTNPGGHLDPGESPRAGARREVMEEAGIDLDPKSLVSLGSNTVTGADGVKRRIHPFKVHLESKPKADHTEDPDQEIFRWRWAPLDALPSPLHVPVERNTLLQRLGLGRPLAKTAALSEEKVRGFASKFLTEPELDRLLDERDRRRRAEADAFHRELKTRLGQA